MFFLATIVFVFEKIFFRLFFQAGSNEGVVFINMVGTAEVVEAGLLAEFVSLERVTVFTLVLS